MRRGCFFGLGVVALLTIHAVATPINEPPHSTLDPEVSTLLQEAFTQPLIDAIAKYAHMEWHSLANVPAAGLQGRSEVHSAEGWDVKSRGMGPDNMFTVKKSHLHSNGRVETVLVPPPKEFEYTATRPKLTLSITIKVGQNPVYITYDPAVDPSPQSMEVTISGVTIEYLYVRYTPQSGEPVALKVYNVQNLYFKTHQAVELAWDSAAMYLLKSVDMTEAEMEEDATALATPKSVRHSVVVTTEEWKFNGYVIGGNEIPILFLSYDKYFSLQSLTLLANGSCVDIVGLNLIGESGVRDRVRQLRRGSLISEVPPKVTGLGSSIASLDLIHNIVCSEISPLMMLFPMMEGNIHLAAYKARPNIVRRRTLIFENTGISDVFVSSGVIFIRSSFGSVKASLDMPPYSDTPDSYKIFEAVVPDGSNWKQQSVTVHSSLDDNPNTVIRTFAVTIPGEVSEYDQSLISLDSNAEQYTHLNVRFTSVMKGVEKYKDVVKLRWNKRSALQLQQTHVATPAGTPGRSIDVHSVRVSLPIDLRLGFTSPTAGDMTLTTPVDTEPYLAMTRIRNRPDGEQAKAGDSTSTELNGRVSLDMSGLVLEDAAHSMKILVQPETVGKQRISGWEYNPSAEKDKSLNGTQDTFPDVNAHVLAKYNRCSALATKGPSVKIQSAVNDTSAPNVLKSVVFNSLGLLGWVIGADDRSEMPDTPVLGDSICHALGNIAYSSV